MAAGSFSPAVPGSPPKVRLLPGSRGPRLGQWQPRVAGTCGQWGPRIRGGRATAAAACGRATAAVSDSAALHQAAAAPRPAAPQVSCCLGPGRWCRPARPRLSLPDTLPLSRVSPGSASTSHQFTAVSRQSQSPCCQQPSPSERFILTQGNARLLLATPGKLCCLAVAGVWPATAIFSLVPRLPYWPQSELLCWHGLCPWSKLLTHSFISTDMHFSYLTILLSCESPQHISGR